MAAKYVICTDLEGVFVPEVWINVAARTGIPELRLTTRDVSDYNVLMKQRIKILAEHGLKLKDIQNVIATIRPLDGAREFLQWLREVTQVIVVSDTFAQFAEPLMNQLDRPTIFCHNLVVDEQDNIIDYTLRQSDPKRKVVQALQSLEYKVIAFGDSYNDVTMLQQAEVGILFCPPQNVIDDYPDLPVVYDYPELKKMLVRYLTGESG
ncbi:MAG: bifunctional phosphoserine phosphatase/homoserine phosphotransferase ThrH [Bacteroidota bacterium]